MDNRRRGTLGMVNGDIVKDLQTQLGLMEISRDHNATLLNSCEKALCERDEKIAQLKDDLKSRNTEIERLNAENKALNSDKWISVDIKPEIGIYYVYINPELSGSFQATAIWTGDMWLIDGYENSNAADLLTHYHPISAPPEAS